jgi:hypothetical protein
MKVYGEAVQRLIKSGKRNNPWRTREMTVPDPPLTFYYDTTMPFFSFRCKKKPGRKGAVPEMQGKCRDFFRKVKGSSIFLSVIYRGSGKW